MTPVKVRNVMIGEGRPKICVPIVGTTQEKILAEAERFVREQLPLDMVEWRADWYEGVFGVRTVSAVESIFDTRAVLNTERAGARGAAGKDGQGEIGDLSLSSLDDIEKLMETAAGLRRILGDIPLLFTFRTAREGGQREISPEDYVALNTAMAVSGFVDLIDVELFSGEETVARLIKTARENHVKVVASNHDFFETPGKEVLLGRLKKMQQLGADILKIAVMPKSRADVLNLLAVTQEMSERYADRPLITMSMGPLGVVSRLVGETFGSALTFGAAAQASAPGQIPAGELAEILEVIHRNFAG